MKFKISKIVEVDVEKERSRIEKCFNKTWQKRLLAILDNFVDGNYEEVNRLYDELPYDDIESHCPGQEFVGMEIMNITINAIYYPELFEKID